MVEERTLFHCDSCARMVVAVRQVTIPDDLRTEQWCAECYHVLKVRFHEPSRCDECRRAHR